MFSFCNWALRQASVRPKHTEMVFLLSEPAGTQVHGTAFASVRFQECRQVLMSSAVLAVSCTRDAQQVNSGLLCQITCSHFSPCPAAFL